MRYKTPRVLFRSEQGMMGAGTSGEGRLSRLKAWMETTSRMVSRNKDISVTKDAITANLTDGRTISVLLAWSWRLSEATPKQRANWKIIGDCYGVHWTDIDEDISAEGMLYGVPASRPQLKVKSIAKKSQKQTKKMYECKT